MTEIRTEPHSDEHETDERAKPSQAREKSIMDSLFDDDSNEDYTLPVDDAGPDSLEAYFARAAQQAEEEDDDAGEGARIFDDEKELESELDRAFNRIVQTPGQSSDDLKTRRSDRESSEHPPTSEKSGSGEEPPPVASAKEKKSLDWPELADDAPPPARSTETESRRQEQDRSEHRAPSGPAPEEKPAAPSRTSREPGRYEVPDWCRRLGFAELNQLTTELADLNKEVRRAQEKIKSVSDRIRDLGELKDTLLSSSGLKLTQACCRIFEELGWSAQISETRSQEIWLKDGDTVQAIVRIVCATGQPNRSDIARLSQSTISYWSSYDQEPKGIMLASTYIEQAPQDRPDDNFSVPVSDFAARKELCLLTCMQLLTIYRDIAIKNVDKKKIRKKLLGAAGVLSKYRLDTLETK